MRDIGILKGVEFEVDAPKVYRPLTDIKGFGFGAQGGKERPLCALAF